MMSAYHVEQYFLHMEPELQEDRLVGGPVYIPGDNAEVGIIQAYDANTGFARIRLFDKVNYMDLVASGVPFNHIVFGTEI